MKRNVFILNLIAQIKRELEELSKQMNAQINKPKTPAPPARFVDFALDFPLYVVFSCDMFRFCCIWQTCALCSEQRLILTSSHTFCSTDRLSVHKVDMSSPEMWRKWSLAVGAKLGRSWSSFTIPIQVVGIYYQISFLYCCCPLVQSRQQTR